MPNVWIWNIDKDSQEFFAKELKEGRLRQGLGYSDRLDLKLLKQKNDRKELLDEEESQVWEHLSVMIMEWGIQLGDIVVVKNTPTWGSYTLAEVIGSYEYDSSGQ